MAFQKKDIDREDVGAMGLSDSLLDKASGGSHQYESVGGKYIRKLCLLTIGDETYLFDKKEDADAFRDGYYAKKGAEAKKGTKIKTALCLVLA